MHGQKDQCYLGVLHSLLIKGVVKVIKDQKSSDSEAQQRVGKIINLKPLNYFIVEQHWSQHCTESALAGNTARPLRSVNKLSRCLYIHPCKIKRQEIPGVGCVSHAWVP